MRLLLEDMDRVPTVDCGPPIPSNYPHQGSGTSIRRRVNTTRRKQPSTLFLGASTFAFSCWLFRDVRDYDEKVYVPFY